MKRVVLHIESLMLRGFRQEDRYAIAEVLQQELTRLFAEPQATQQLTTGEDLSRLRIGKVVIDQGAKPSRIGQQVARAITKGVKR